MCNAVVVFCATVLVGTAPAQTTSPESSKLVRITGRLVDPDGRPVIFVVQLFRIDPDGLKVEAAADRTREDGTFTLLATPAKYEISLGDGMKTPPKMVDTGSGKDIDVGDMLFQYCATVGTSPSRPPTKEFVGDLKREQIVIEPQVAVDPYGPGYDLPPALFKPDVNGSVSSIMATLPTELPVEKKKRRISPAGKRKMAEAQKKCWAAFYASKK
jgi:hypothetical protein